MIQNATAGAPHLAYIETFKSVYLTLITYYTLTGTKIEPTE